MYSWDVALYEVARKMIQAERRMKIIDRSPFHAKALYYFDKMNADERYWR